MREDVVRKNVIMRRGEPKDLNSLLAICRQCFPDHYRWQSYYDIGRKWWKAVLQSQSCQTLVLKDDIGIFALNVLVLDFRLWREEEAMRNGTIPERVFSILCSPFPAVWRRLLTIAKNRLTYRKCNGKRPRKYEGKRIAWSEIIAVSPRMRRKGYGMLLNNARSQIALEAGASVIQTHIEAWNLESRKMNEKMGHVLISESVRGCLYEKLLVKEEGGAEAEKLTSARLLNYL